MSDFAGKVVIVTGASSGIGLAIAIEFAKQGAMLSIGGRSAEALQKVADDIKTLGCKKEPLQIVGDIAQDSVQKKLIDGTVAKFGRLDILVNNAGIITAFDNVEHEKLMEGFDQVHAVNVRAPLQLMHLAAEHLAKTKGNIVNISSIAAYSPMMPIYCSSKAALDMITKSVAIQLAPKGIRVNSVNPGPVKSNIMRGAGVTDIQVGQAVFEQYGEKVPLKFLANGTDIANMVLFVANQKLARNVTGSNLINDTGMLLDPGCMSQAVKDMEEMQKMAKN